MTRGFGRAAHLVIRHSTVVDTVVANGCASCTVDFEEEEPDGDVACALGCSTDHCIALVGNLQCDG